MEASHQATLSDSGEAPLFNQYILDIENLALASVAQWIECRPVNRKVACLIPSQGTCLGRGPGPQLGAREATRCYISHTSVFLSSFSLPFPSL